MEHGPESLGPDEVCRGKLVKAGHNGYSRKLFDILTAFLDVLGKPTGQVPDNMVRAFLYTTLYELLPATSRCEATTQEVPAIVAGANPSRRCSRRYQTSRHRAIPTPLRQGRMESNRHWKYGEKHGTADSAFARSP
jgi:hypothetical protein